MDFDVPLRDLGAFDIAALSETILGQDDAAWNEDEFRQETFYVHDQTRSIVMFALEDENWPCGQTRRGPGWARIADVAMPVMREIITQHYPQGGEVIRAVAARLRAGGNIKPHIDVNQSFHCAHRIHVPISTSRKVWFTIDGRPFQFKLGRVYEINNQKQHSVVNRGTEDRITFIFDYIPPGPLACDPGGGETRPENLSVQLPDMPFRIPPEAPDSDDASSLKR